MYEKLDQLIVGGIALGKKPNYAKSINDVAYSIASETGRETYRVIDGRLKALKAKGIIVYRKKQLNNGRGGWHVV